MSKEAEKKISQVRKLKAGEVLFHDGDEAHALYIIQRGQLRLFKPKGKGFVEIAVLRSGEIIGEMAIIDEGNDKAGRSCSAEAIVATEVLEIFYEGFQKSLDSLNPLFRSLFVALVSRLKKTNLRVRELESNSLAYGSKTDYVFIKDNEIIKILASYYLIGSTFGKRVEGYPGTRFNKKLLQIYSSDVFGLSESKIESMAEILREHQILTIEEIKEESIAYVVIHNRTLLRDIISFYQAERYLADSKKLSIGEKSCLFLKDVFEVHAKQGVSREHREATWSWVSIESIKGEDFNIVDYLDAQKAAIIRETYVDDKGLELEVNIPKLTRYLPILLFKKDMDKLNQSKKS